MKKILIIDYKMGNLRSVANKFRRMEIDCIVSSYCEDIKSAEKLILPGVGHFKYGMENLQNLGLIDILNKKVIDEKTPILGICLGAQLFCKHSEEGNCKGLESASKLLMFTTLPLLNVFFGKASYSACAIT